LDEGGYQLTLTNEYLKINQNQRQKERVKIACLGVEILISIVVGCRGWAESGF
jgi:hypothetical protein